MKSVSILIPNRDTYEMLQLCIESVRKYTRYPHRIIVCDDNSQGGVDLEYLREGRDKGWLELYENDKQLYHGGMLNRLVNEICDTELAFLMDSDVQILKPGWLQDFITLISEGDDIIAVWNTLLKYFTPHCYRVPVYHVWFGLLNMTAYRDGMQVDWASKQTDRRDEPFKTIFAPYYPPREAGISWDSWDENFVAIDPGGNPWVKFNYDNPRGYRVIPMPSSLGKKYHHYDHISCLVNSVPHELLALANNPEQPADRKEEITRKKNFKFLRIKDELNKLRGKEQ